MYHGLSMEWKWIGSNKAMENANTRIGGHYLEVEDQV